MEQNIIINITPKTNEIPPISIQATIKNFAGDIKTNNSFEFVVNSTEPLSATIPRSSAEGGYFDYSI